MVPGSSEAVDELHATWVAKGTTILEPPNDEVFGRTFFAADPDRNPIHVSPLD